MGDTGFETPSFSKRKTAEHSKSGAKSDAFAALAAVLPDANGTLRSLLAVWPKLTDDERQTLADHAELLSLAQPAAGATPRS